MADYTGDNNVKNSPAMNDTHIPARWLPVTRAVVAGAGARAPGDLYRRHLSLLS